MTKGYQYTLPSIDVSTTAMVYKANLSFSGVTE